MTSSDDVDEKPLVKGLLGLVVGLVAVGVLAGRAAEAVAAAERLPVRSTAVIR